jgi:peptidoglycan/xylan/chitin deacetylase (PgdA/CDA1 family)
VTPLVLAYHGVAHVPFGVDRYRLFVSPRQVERDLRALRRWGYELTTFGELARRIAEVGADAAGALAAITFDDGLADNEHHLLPLLQQHRAPATVFVVSGWLGGEHPDAPGMAILDVDGVRRLRDAGVEIGAHGRRHLHLPLATDDELAEELLGGRGDLEDVLGAPIGSLAYPYGESDARVRAAAERAGFAAACRTSGEGRWDDPLDLPRQAMGNGASMLGLRLKRIDRYEALLRARPARWARRVSRRSHNHLEARRRAGHPTARRRPPG